MNATLPFRLIDPPHDPPEEVQRRSREFIAKVRWTFASTMPQWPHEYVVRARIPRALKADYDQLAADIGVYGWRGVFGRKHPHRYMNAGDGFRYWRCEDPNCWACVINRARNDDLLPRQLRLDEEAGR